MASSRSSLSLSLNGISSCYPFLMDAETRVGWDVMQNVPLPVGEVTDRESRKELVRKY